MSAKNLEYYRAYLPSKQADYTDVPVGYARELLAEVDRLAVALTAANAREAALRKEAAEAIEAAYKSGITETSSMPGPKIIEQMWQDSDARRAAQRIGGAE